MTSMASLMVTPPPAPPSGIDLEALIRAIGALLVSFGDVFIWFFMLGVVLLLPPVRRLVFDCQPKHIEIPTPAPRSHRVDAIRAIAITAVMGIHALYFPAEKPGMDLPDWVTATQLNNFMRFAVPVFLILSGYCLPSWKTLGTPSLRINFYKKKAIRLLMPYAIVSSLLFLLTHPFSWTGLFQTILCGTASPPFYFLVVLFQLYLIYPVLCRLSHHPLLLLSLSLIISGSSYLYQPSQNIYDFPLFSAYLFPFVFGMVSKNLHSSLSSSTPQFIQPSAIPALSYMIPNVMLAFVAIIGGYSTSAVGLYSYNFQFFYAIAVLFTLSALLVRLPPLAKALSPMGKYSLWIFLLHHPVQEGMWRLVSPQTSSQAMNIALLLWIALTFFCWWISQCISCRVCKSASS